MPDNNSDSAPPPDAEFSFSDCMAGVWGGTEDYRADVESLTGSPAVRMTAVPDGPATVLAPLPIAPDLTGVQEQLRSTFASADEAAVYRRTATNVVVGAGALHEASFVMAVRLYANEKWRDRFRDWLHDEHLSRQPTTGGVRWAHLYETLNGGEHWHFLNLWGGDDHSIFDSTEWAEIRDTERFLEVAPVFEECRSQRQIFRVG